MSAPVAAFGRFLIATSALLVLVLVLEHGLPRLSLGAMDGIHAAGRHRRRRLCAVLHVRAADGDRVARVADHGAHSGRDAARRRIVPARTADAAARAGHRAGAGRRRGGSSAMAIRCSSSPAPSASAKPRCSAACSHGLPTRCSASACWARACRRWRRRPAAALTGTAILARRLRRLPAIWRCRMPTGRVARAGLHGRARHGHRLLLVLRRREGDRSRARRQCSSISCRSSRSRSACCCWANRSTWSMVGRRGAGRRRRLDHQPHAGGAAGGRRGDERMTPCC